jgi:hypothetical protein
MCGVCGMMSSVLPELWTGMKRHHRIRADYPQLLPEFEQPPNATQFLRFAAPIRSA